MICDIDRCGSVWCLHYWLLPEQELQALLLFLFLEWKEDYRPPPSPQSTEVSLQSLQSPTEIFAGPTLVDDVTKRPQNVSLPSIPKENVITADVHQQVVSIATGSGLSHCYMLLTFERADNWF